MDAQAKQEVIEYLEKQNRIPREKPAEQLLPQSCAMERCSQCGFLTGIAM